MQLSDLVTDVRPDVMGAPTFVMLDAIQKAAEAFFVDSGAWISELDAITIEQGVFEYDLSPPNDVRVLRIHAESDAETGVKIDNDRMTVVSQSNLFMRHRDPAGGRPQLCAFTVDQDVLHLWPTPDADSDGATVSVLAVLAPTREAVEIPDVLGVRFRHAIVSRAKAALMLSSGKAWSNPQLGSLEMQKYNDAVASARRDTITARFAGPQSVRMRPFA